MGLQRGDVFLQLREPRLEHPRVREQDVVVLSRVVDQVVNTRHPVGAEDGVPGVLLFKV